MATLEQLETALRNADAAGDTEAATALAAEYSRMRGQRPAQGQQPSAGVVAGFREGLSNTIGGVGETLKQYAGVNVPALQDGAAKVAPGNYQPAPVLDKDGLHAGNLPQAIAEGAPGMAADIGVAKLASKVPLVGKYAAIPAGIASYLLRTRGQAAIERAQNRTGEADAQPTTGDKAAALATGAVEAIPQALTLGRFLPGAGAVTATGKAGIGQALSEGVKTAAIAGGSSAASDVASQVGATIGTDNGVQVDPYRIGNAGITGAATGGLLKAPRTAADAAAAFKYRAITPELRDAAGRVSNRILEAADGNRLTNTAHADEALNKAHDGIQSELGNAIRDLKSRVTLGPDAENAFGTLRKGSAPSPREMSAIEAAVQGDPAAQHVLDLSRDAHALSVLKGTGESKNGHFVGGLATKVASLGGLTTHGATKAALGALAVDALGSHLITYSPEMLAGLGGAYAGSRAIDKLTGNRSPVNKFAQRFADPSQGIRTPAPQPARGAPQSPTGPKVSPVQMPWGNAAPFTPPAGPDPVREQIKEASELMAARRANAQLQQQQAKDQQREAIEQTNARRANLKLKGAQLSQEATGLREQKQDATSLVAARLAAMRQAQQAARAQQQDASGLMEARNAHLQGNIRNAMDLMDARRANAKLEGADEGEASAPTGPASVVPKATIAQRALGKIKKRNGSVHEEGGPQAEPEASQYVPLKPEEMKYRGQSDDYKANLEMAGENIDRAKAERYRASIIKKQKMRRGALAELAADHPADENVMAELLHQLHEVRRRSIAKDAVEHYARLMTPEGAAAVRAKFNTEFIGSVWPK